MKFGEKLKVLRNDKDLTQDEVAAAIGISRRAYISYEQQNTRPRKQETYEKLAEIFECDVNSLRIEDDDTGTGGMATAAAILSTVLGTIGFVSPIGAVSALATLKAITNTGKTHSHKEEIPEEPLTYTNDMLLQYEKRQKRFSAIALGMLYRAAAEKGIICRKGDLKSIDNLGIKPDESILVSGHSIHNWWLIFWAKDEKLDKNIIVTPEARAGVLLSRFTTSIADPYRMASIIVDDLELFDALAKFRNHNSYRGNMSAILVNTDTVTVEKELMLSYYNEDEKCENTFLTIM